MEDHVVRHISLCAGWILVAALLVGLNCQPTAAETRIDFDGGAWIPFLPDYTAASIVESVFPNTVVQPDLFQDDQIDVGGQIGVSGLVDIGRPGWMIEFDLDLAGLDSMGSSATFADPGAGESVWLASLARQRRTLQQPVRRSAETLSHQHGTTGDCRSGHRLSPHGI